MEPCKEHRSEESPGGFDKFLLEVASSLTLTIVINLATFFKFSPADKDKIERDEKNYGSFFLKSLKEKGVISETDISKLLDSLEEIGLKGVACDVNKSFRRNLTQSHSWLGVSPERKREELTYKKRQFLKEIKETYEGIYNGVLPIPYYRERSMCVNNVFIDSSLEYLEEHGDNKGKGTWQKLDSYNSVLIDPRLMNAMVFLILGEPGYGKSILALQYLYDWCTKSVSSPLKGVELLIFLRLRCLKSFESIFSAVKHFLLPCDTKLSEKDIADIIQSCKSVHLILDGFDEYSNSDNPNSDVTKIIAGQMLRGCKVILTTRPHRTPSELKHRSARIRLKGFNDFLRERYIMKAVVDNNSLASAKILQQLRSNMILTDICQVPLFFVMFAHLTYEKDMTVVLNSVTSFFRYVMSCLYEHIQIKLDTRKVHAETEHGKLEQLALESLKEKKRNLLWEKLVDLVGETFCNELLDIGILFEQKVLKFVDDPGTSVANHIQRRTDVCFNHKLFCEWYAAHYVAKCATELEGNDLRRFFENIDPFDLEYVYRFACGLSSTAAQKIIQYLYSIEGGDKFAILCILEQTGEIDRIKDPIQDMCLEGVIVSGHDSLLLLQRSSMQLLEIASESNIPIRSVSILNNLQSIDLCTPAIITTSGLALTSRIPVKWLWIILFDREMTEGEAISLLQFSSMCPSLRGLGIYGCVPPRSFKIETTLSSLKSRNVTVLWRLHVDTPIYTLNLISGRWECTKDGTEPTKADFEKALSMRAELIQTVSEEYYRDHVKKSRDKLRKLAEKKLTNGQQIWDDYNNGNDDNGNYMEEMLKLMSQRTF